MLGSEGLAKQNSTATCHRVVRDSDIRSFGRGQRQAISEHPSLSTQRLILRPEPALLLLPQHRPWVFLLFYLIPQLLQIPNQRS